MFAWTRECSMVQTDPIPASPKEAQVAVRSRRDLRMPGGMFRQNRITGRVDKPSQAFGGASRHKNRGATVNTISLFGSAATPAAWVEIFLGLSALTMFSTVPDWQS